MHKLLFTGDTHSNVDLWKLDNKRFPQGKDCDKLDNLIIAGDCGACWIGDEHDKDTIIKLGNKKYQTLFIDGNHENHTKLDSLPQTYWHNGYTHSIDYIEKVPKWAGDQYTHPIHLMRGYVFTINGKKIFTFGGAESIDKRDRIENISWWSRELPSYIEYECGLQSLDDVNWEVDYVVTHSAPQAMLSYLHKNHSDRKYDITNQLTEYLDIIQRKLKYKWWFCGHYHRDLIVQEKRFIFVYNNIYEVHNDKLELIVNNGDIG